MIIGIMGLAFSLIALVIFLFSDNIKIVPVVWILGLLSFMVLTGSCVFFIYKTEIFRHDIYFDEEGIKVINSRGKIKREICWCEVRRFAVSQAERESNIYMCVSSNVELAPIYLYMYGIVNATLYDKNTISLPANARIVRYCEKNLSTYGIATEYTGLVQNCKTHEMKEFLIKKRKMNNIVYSLIGLCTLLVLIVIFFSLG